MTSSRLPYSDGSLAYVEQLHQDYLEGRISLPDGWKQWFDAIERDQPSDRRSRLGPSFRPPRLFEAGPLPPPDGQEAFGGRRGVSEAAVLQERLAQLVRAYREWGHSVARLDPLGLTRPSRPELDPEFHGFIANDLDREFSARTVLQGADILTLREILQRLKNTYCRSIGVQFSHIADAAMREWLRRRMEETENRIGLSRQGQLRILTKLTDAVIFEEFLQTKYLGAKVFSLEGCESLIPLLTFALDGAADAGIDAVVLAMAHRGRLNVLSNIMGKSPREIFREFEDQDPEMFMGSGDVKYHLGYESEYLTHNQRKVRVSLCFNPSHLEFVNPVALGRVRARQDQLGPGSPGSTLAVLIHGDAALAGEGIVSECLNLSQLRAYSTGGTIHVVVNNQIGFTTAPSQGRSSTYATDVAKMLDVPIFHVNGEDPEAVAQVVQLALDFRQQFTRDVFIDMYGYRRHGHNEGDEPSFTQPQLYEAISRRVSVRDGYLEHLLHLGGVTRKEADQIAVDRRNMLEVELSAARRREYGRTNGSLNGAWEPYRGGREEQVPEATTAVEQPRLMDLLGRVTSLPEGFQPHRKLVRFLEQRAEMAAQTRPLDWGAAEALAFATLATEGFGVRMTGQDCERGTFSHRHAVLHDVRTGQTYAPLAHLAPDQAAVQIHNSPLSEAAVLGFEYGYSLESPRKLLLWEAQFGDFVNAAQVIIDQFLVSAEDKWRLLSGLVLLLPHGFEGMGPEHSSARLERWLLLAAEDNIQVCQPSTPAQYFHLLRRQVHRAWRKPLVILTPKSLLRHPRATSSLGDLIEGRFRRVLADPNSHITDNPGVGRILLCSGKVYYALEQRREELGRKDVAILRVEQFYPLPDERLSRALEPYREGTPVVWIQEEPENMGAWRHIRARFGATLFGRFPLSLVARPASASPATGSASSHQVEQEEILDKAFQS